MSKVTQLINMINLALRRVSWQDKIKNLKTLDLCYSGVRDGHLANFSNLPALEELNLDSCPCGDWSIAHLADNQVVPNLTSLGLADTDLTDLGMVHLHKFKKLSRLSLFYCNISNAGLRHIAGMTNLEILNLDSREIGDNGLVYLTSLKKLRSLDIFSSGVTDNGCHHISRIQSLESLELCGGGIGDRGCTYLATLENLISLNLSQNDKISNKGAAALAALSTLKSLNLSNTRVNAGALPVLSALVNLQSLAMYGCRGMEDEIGLNKFQDRLPALKCLRLNNGRSSNDGTINRSEHESEDEDDDEGIDDNNDDDDDDDDDDGDIEEEIEAATGMEEIHDDEEMSEDEGEDSGMDDDTIYSDD